MRNILKILVIDDDDTDRMSVRRGLRRAGFEVDIIEILDGRTAIETLKSQPFDCVFLDYKLPDGDGLAVLREVRSAGVKTPIVVFTAFGNEQTAVEIMRAGATDYLPKDDCSPDTVGRTMRRALRLRELESEKEKALRALANSERLTRAVINSLHDHLMVLDRNANIITLNDACLKFLRSHMTLDEDATVRGMKLDDFSDLVARPCRAQVDSIVKGVRAVLRGRRKRYEKETVYQCESGPQTFIVRATPLIREQGGAVLVQTPAD